MAHSDARRRPGFAVALLASTALCVAPQVALAQQKPAKAEKAKPGKAVPIPLDAPAAAPATAAPAPVVAQQQVKSITIEGAQRLESDTILSYIRMRVGDPYTQASADQVLKDLYATELFAEVQLRNANGDVVIQVKENPVVNRIILEGNKRLKEDKILPEIKLTARQIFTRSKVRADVARIIELYKRQGRFAASVEPKMVMLDQNRVDIVFEIQEGPKSKVRQINIIGNDKFSDSELRGQMVTKQARAFRLFSSGTSYDPDRLAFDQQKLRQFYLTNGYADFRVVSAVAELTPDKRDFIITYVVEEGQRYHLGDVKVDSQLRDFDGEQLAKRLPLRKGDWYDAKLVEDTVDSLTETAGSFGYAFADVRPDFNRNKDDLTMSVTFRIAEAPRVYVERVDVNGNTLTQDKVIRREFRLAEGDAFNSYQIKRSSNRIKSLGYFQEKFEVEQKPGSAQDRIVLEANVEEKPTGQLQLSAGFSSLESFIFQASIQQNNFRGRGQTVGLSGDYSRFSRSVQVSFTEPYLFDRNVSMGVDIYRRDYNSFNFLNTNRNTTYKQATTGFQIRAGVPLTEYMSLIGRYTLNYDDVRLDQATYFLNGKCSILLAGRYLCDAIGKRTSSILGASLVYDTLDNRLRPTKGTTAVVGGDFAGLGGSVKYARITANAARYFPLGKGFVFSLRGEGGAIKPLSKRFDNDGVEIEGARLTDRFFLGEPQIRGFDIRGVGPRVIRKFYSGFDQVTGAGGTVSNDRNSWSDDSVGGRYYYLAHAELEIPLGSGAREMGLRPSIFADAGAVFGVRNPLISATNPTGAGSIGQIVYRDASGNLTDKPTTNGVANTPAQKYDELYLGNSPKPRISVGIGVNWNSPFGPFRINFAKVLSKVDGDDPKTFNFNVGTQF
ncbi:outer membrane protein assembly factor BamA [Novosphingobium cyanobacteriorum]|uniref:Outer membrane protein assembly factor BamA n=1 Tax=Novosphingobium cyanobacteriorum TaxID=3024215 RepID=A0ABT6CLS5_9SPHN|nr:outer membrane protein assembly factor BamA [Novosphingobium cyanobacteriorum]MDF8334867.1 outer membrane protein assembly factor BamA [Novosphingobium cyanobacteriorum]